MGFFLEFKQFIKHCNTLDRQDVFHSRLVNFITTHKDDAHEERGLLVVYKNGMRTFAVIYKDDIVFPPSVPQTLREASESVLVSAQTMSTSTVSSIYGLFF